MDPSSPSAAAAANEQQQREEGAEEEEVVILSRQRRDPIEVCRNCPQRIYIELGIPADVQSVDQIVFTLSSHDQGRFSSLP